MITLYAFGPAFGVADPSPFVLKTDAFMRLNEMEFESRSSFKYLQKAPKGKLPYIKDGDQLIADSFFIQQYLTEKYQLKIDETITPEQHAQAHFISRAIEESLYWCIVYFRWIYAKNWPIIKEEFFSKMPFPLKIIAPFMARKSVISAMRGHGLSRHTEQEILTIAKGHLEAISTLLGDKDYCFGNQPCSLDATVFAFLAEIYLASLSSPLKELANNYTNLEKYCERFQAKYYA